MDKGYFSMLCNKLSTEIRCDENINKPGYLTPLWEAFNHFENKRFAEVIEFLKDTWQYRKFPIRADFNNAINATRKETYKPEPRNEKIEPYGQEVGRVMAAFRIMDEIRNVVCKEIPGYNPASPNTAKTWPIMRKFYRGAIASQQVYNTQTKTWGKRDGQQYNFQLFDPLDWGFGSV